MPDPNAQEPPQPFTFDARVWGVAGDLEVNGGGPGTEPSVRMRVLDENGQWHEVDLGPEMLIRDDEARSLTLDIDGDPQLVGRKVLLEVTMENLSNVDLNTQNMNVLVDAPMNDVSVDTTDGAVALAAHVNRAFVKTINGQVSATSADSLQVRTQGERRPLGASSHVEVGSVHWADVKSTGGNIHVGKITADRIGMPQPTPPERARDLHDFDEEIVAPIPDPAVRSESGRIIVDELHRSSTIQSATGDINVVVYDGNQQISTAGLVSGGIDKSATPTATAVVSDSIGQRRGLRDERPTPSGEAVAGSTLDPAATAGPSAGVSAAVAAPDRATKPVNPGRRDGIGGR